VHHVAHDKAPRRTVVVRAGDTLSGIAHRAHVRGGWRRLAAANRQLKNPNVLRIGQRLHLPA
jgi:nucleoid-associated protein YgaU